MVKICHVVFVAALMMLSACCYQDKTGVLCTTEVEYEGDSAKGEGWSFVESQGSMQVSAVKNGCQALCETQNPGLSYSDEKIKTCRDNCYEENKSRPPDKAARSHMKSDCQGICAKFQSTPDIERRCVTECLSTSRGFRGRCRVETRSELSLPLPVH